MVRAALDRHGVPARRLGIELTESSVLHATGSSYRALQELSDMGVDLVLDDFGTGYSAVAALLASPIRGIKLDRSFTSRLGVDPQADLVTRALGGMVEALGFRGVAEGVETEAQCAAVQAHGWKYGQGWLFGRPAPAHRRRGLSEVASLAIGFDPPVPPPRRAGAGWWAGMDSNHRRQNRRVYSPFPLATRAPTQEPVTVAERVGSAESSQGACRP